jgi:hypothetical protein
VKQRSLIILFFLISFQGIGQEAKRTFIIEPKVHSGLNMPFYKALNYLAKDDIYAFDLSVSFPTYGKDFWEKLYRNPRTGIGYSYWTLGNDKVFGRAHALYGFMNISLYKPSEKLSVNYQISFGGAYLTRIFDITDNHLNRAIGAHANIYIRLGIDCRIKIIPNGDLVVEAGATHFSNGKTKSPNYGINTGTFSIGFNYLLNNPLNKTDDPVIPKPEKKYVQSIIYSAGAKVYDNLNGKRYFVSSVAYNLERYLNVRRKIGLGADFFYDKAISEALAAKDGTPEKDFSKLVRFGLHTSYASRYKRASLGIQIGYYVYSKYTDLTNIYSRISGQYLITTNIIGSVGIKTHFGKADFIEWGLGYCW